MEKIKSICVMRELLMAMNDLELQMESLFGVSINESMVLCCIGRDTLTASQISEIIGMTPSNTSKVLRSIERKGLITRALGDTDRRQMRFSLTETGDVKLQEIKNKGLEIPEFIKPLFD